MVALTLKRFPDLRIPYHSRWRHFEAGGIDRKAQLDGLLAGRSADDVARAVVACIRRPRPEVYPHRMSRALTILNAVAPAFTDRVVRRFGRRRHTAMSAAPATGSARQSASAAACVIAALAAEAGPRPGRRRC